MLSYDPNKNFKKDSFTKKCFICSIKLINEHVIVEFVKSNSLRTFKQNQKCYSSIYFCFCCFENNVADMASLYALYQRNINNNYRKCCECDEKAIEINEYYSIIFASTAKWNAFKFCLSCYENMFSEEYMFDKRELLF